jgi:hypothetical protein
MVGKARGDFLNYLIKKRVYMKTNGKKANKPGKVYPEQSERQALRGQRRAQGGQGITEGHHPQSRNPPAINVLNEQPKIESI